MTKSRIASRSPRTLTLLTVVSRPVSCYELSTHAALTREAAMASRLFPMSTGSDEGSVLLQRLGLGDQADSLGAVYIDMARGDAEERSIYPCGLREDLRQTRSMTPTGIKSTKPRSFHRSPPG